MHIKRRNDKAHTHTYPAFLSRCSIPLVNMAGVNSEVQQRECCATAWLWLIFHVTHTHGLIVIHGLSFIPELSVSYNSLLMDDELLWCCWLVWYMRTYIDHPNNTYMSDIDVGNGKNAWWKAHSPNSCRWMMEHFVAHIPRSHSICSLLLVLWVHLGR